MRELWTFFWKIPYLQICQEIKFSTLRMQSLFFCLVARPRDSKDMVLRRRKPYVLIQLSKEREDTYLFSPYFLWIDCASALQYKMLMHLAMHCHSYVWLVDIHLWHYRLWSFKTKDTKLERFLHKNLRTQRKLLNFENWTNGEPQYLACKNQSF